MVIMNNCEESQLYSYLGLIDLYIQIKYWAVHLIYTIQKESRHMVVCRVAQEAITSHRDYIDRKTKNVIFTPM